MASLLGATLVRLALDQPKTSKETASSFQRLANNNGPFRSMELLEAVQQQCVAAIVRLYSASDARGDVVDLDGNNALHLAVKTGNVTVVRAVLLFYERRFQLSRKRNNKGRHPVDLTENDEIKKCFEIFDPANVSTSSSPRTQSLKAEIDRDRNLQCVKGTLSTQDGRLSILLSLDGGGIRGIVIILVLMAMERKLGGEKVTRYFDWCAGTSTGAIIAIGLGLDKSLEDCLKIYLRLKSEIFVTSRPYNVKTYETYLKEVFGVGTRMSEIKRHKVIVTACQTNMAPPKLKLFRSFQPVLDAKDMRELEYDGPDSVYCWKAARASSAAPTYFSTFEGIYSDGGIMANNPTTELLTEFFRYKDIQEHVGETPPAPLGCVISVGTGICPPVALSSKASRGTDFLKLISQSAQLLKQMALVFVKQLTASDGLPVERSQSWCHALGVPFFRFSPPLTQKVELDECRDTFIVQLMWDVEVYMATTAADDLEELVRFLQKVRANERNN